MADTTNELKNGVYRSKSATYFVKDNKIMMLVNGGCYKITADFMMGHKYYGPLTDEMIEVFEQSYEKAKKW